MFKKTPITLTVAAVLALPGMVVAADQLQPGPIETELQQLRAAHAANEARLKELEARMAGGQGETTMSAPTSVSAPTGGNITRVNPAPFNIGLSALFAAGGSSVDDDALANLQAGGHDPSRNGFTVQNVELSISGAVDPYLDGQANLIFLIDRDGETVVELEEAFLATRALPYGLQLKAGQFFTEFGRQNAQHPHTWAFVDQPVVLSRFFGGDGLRSQGARLAWLMPLPWYSELYLGAQNAKGETVTSFLWAPDEEVGGYTLIDRGGARKAADLLWSARWLNGTDLSDTVSVNLGVSALSGPNASATDTDTRIYGADLYLKWRPVVNQRGFPFVAWQTEWLTRDYETPDGALEDGGGYTQVLYGFAPRWVAGLRMDYADGKGDDGTDALRDRRKRYAPNVTFYPTEFSKLRLQYNRDWAEHLDDHTANSVWLQYEYNLGAHAAHKF